MRTLFLTRWRPHRPDGGAQLRNAQNIAALGALGTVDVLSIGREETVGPVEGIGDWHHFRRQPPRGTRTWLLRPGYHPLADGYRHPAAERQLARLLAERRYDLAVVEEIALARYIAPIRAAGTPVVFDAHNVEARLRADLRPRGGSWRPGLGRSLLDRRLARIEGRAVGAADLVWACSPVDADALAQLHAPRTAIAVVPNTVDVGAYAAARAGQARPVPAGAPVALVYTGTYSYPPNAAAALELIGDILPALRKLGEAPRLALVGREPGPAIVAAAAADPDVTLTGAVPSILPRLAEPCLMPLPIRHGSGTRLKILEAFAAGCAVVATPKAVEGIEAADGREIRLAETAAEFAAALRGLWHDPAARAAQAAAALRLVEARYSWQAAARAIHASLRAHLGLEIPEPEAA
jgi:glycosyltransferase involved in cell wall biosynthesis